MDLSEQMRSAGGGNQLGRVLAEALSELGLEPPASAEGVFHLQPLKAGEAAVDIVGLLEEKAVLLLSRLGYVTYGHESAYRVLLQQHYLGTETTGAVFAVDPVTNEVVLQCAIPLSAVTGATLAGAILAFTARATAARQAIATQ